MPITWSGRRASPPQACVGPAAVVGIVVGVPVGIALGRAIWQAFARNLGVLPVTVITGWAIVDVAAGVGSGQRARRSSSDRCLSFAARCPTRV
jgi:hypothetical protein